MPEKSIVLSTMTATGQKRAAELFPQADQIFFLPLDFWFSQKLAVRRTSPSVLILTETEIWPNLIRQCRKQNIPVFLVNARLSARSFKYYHALRFLFGPLLNTLQLVACQSREDAGRYLALGARQEIVTVTGNLKYDGIKGPVSAAEKQGLRKDFGLSAGDLAFTAGSTREGEEAMILGAWQQVIQNSKFKIQNVKLVIAPRHPGRFSEVEKLISSQNLEYVKRSDQKNSRTSGGFQVLLLDTIGELVNAYAASDLSFVGGSLVPVGGHNPLEPAALGLPVIFGPHMFNARESTEGLLECGGAVRVNDAGELGKILIIWLKDPGKRKAAGEKARVLVDSKRGVSKVAAELVAEKLALLQ
ncbi:3-deoxy-D-manno-octulosonic acid transferase [candidate division TA06 bacterium]|uniref:3-deoxy-D-manno-octulosonic acid transferase n=1 Tax=candidate division TA06 bacterium TaxID=2250710 RepID=A0A933MJC1_UNCT6|nr:3-deoxy-D-manno-octulosonic acid transferase [candidate division TA06 bacterium]